MRRMDLEDKKTIIISMSSGIIARNFLLVPDGFLFHARKIFNTIVLVVPQSTQEFYRNKIADKQVVIETIGDNNHTYENNSSIKKIFTFFYTYLLFGENAKRLAWEGVYFASRPKDTWSGRFSYPLKWFIGNSFGRSNWVRTRLVPFIDTFIHREEYFNDLFLIYKPDLVFTPNVEKWQDICLIREARKRDIPSVGMPGSWDHLPKRYRPLHPDILLVNTSTQKIEAVTYQSYSEHSVKIVGVPYYDAFVHTEYIKTREIFCKEIGLDPDKKIIFFSSEGIYTPDDKDIAEILHAGVRNNMYGTPTQLFVRPYPAQDSEHAKFDFLNDEKDVYVDWIDNHLKRGGGDEWYPLFDDVIHFMNIMYHCDVIINTYSSISIEAAYFNRQPIGINFDGYKTRPWDMSVKRFANTVHLKNIIDTGAVRLVESENELHDTITQLLSQPVVSPMLEVLRHKMCGPLDGRTGERIVDQLKNV